MIPKVVGLKKVHIGQFLKFYNFILSNGQNYEVVSRRDLTMYNLNNLLADAVEIIAFSPDFQKLLIIKEWRIPVNDYIFSFPAGLRETDEQIFDTAARELYEETGLSIRTILDVLPPSYQSAGMTNEAVATVICSATGQITNKNASEHENIFPIWVSKADALDLLSSGKFSGRCQMVLSFWANDSFLNRV